MKCPKCKKVFFIFKMNKRICLNEIEYTFPPCPYCKYDWKEETKFITIDLGDEK